MAAPKKIVLRGRFATIEDIEAQIAREAAPIPPQAGHGQHLEKGKAFPIDKGRKRGLYRKSERKVRKK